MLLKQCYIENFGKLHNFTYDFTEGLNIICEENGWGKSTFAAFVRAMFYGMSQGGSRSKLEDAERRKYKPWQGGETGGYLIFEVNGKEYKAERTFGMKESEDTFRLIDLSTNLESEDFSSELGKELFGLDKEAYSRSTYLPQNKIADGGMNDSIGRKLGRIAEGEEESGNFEAAYGKLDDLRKKYIPDRGKEEKGYIAELNRRISETQMRLEGCRSKGENAKPWRQKEQEAAEERKQCERELKHCRERLEIAAGYEAAAAKKRHYEELQRQEKELHTKKQRGREWFPEGVPEQEELGRCRKSAEEAMKIEGELRSYEFSPEETKRWEQLCERFYDGIPECEQIQEYLREERELSPKRDELMMSREREEEYGTQMEKRRKLCKGLGMLLGVIALVLFGAAIAGGGIALWLMAGIAALTGLLISAVGFGSGKKRRESEKRIQDLDAEQKKYKEKDQEVGRLLKRYGCDEAQGVTDELYRLSEFVREYEGYAGRKEKHDRCIGHRESLLSESRKLLRRCGMDAADITGELAVLEQRCRDWNVISKEYDEAVKKREQFEKENSPESFLEIVPPEESYRELQNREREITEKIDLLEVARKDYGARADAFEEEAEACGELEEQLGELQKELEDKRYRHRMITETMDCLKKAREQFSARYLRKVQQGFREYARLLGEEAFGGNGAAGEVDTDINLQIQVSVHGKGKELGYFSTGTRDLLGLCMRFALVDAMFDEERPFMVLDDPFVNFDEKKLSRALEFLKRASEKYQILYFVCHRSRGR